MILEHFLLSINETNCYILGCSDTNSAALIDPGEWNERLSGFLTGLDLKLETVLITHSHHDHTGGIDALRTEFSDVKVMGQIPGSYSGLELKDGDVVEVGQLHVRVLETPGHTDDSLSFVVGGDIFCGDLIFAGSIGGTSDRASFDREVQSIRQKILTLGDDMVLHPGHGPATTVGIERLFNPFLIP
jgi:glyoxylase-like metal-dependent hydrolase (beta-lactamase superfamily II)